MLLAAASLAGVLRRYPPGSIHRKFLQPSSFHLHDCSLPGDKNRGVEFQEPDNDAFSFLFRPPRSRRTTSLGEEADPAYRHLHGHFAAAGCPRVERLVRPPEFTVDSRRSRLVHSGASVRLTQKELQLVESLLAAEGDLVAYLELAHALWGKNVPPAFAVAIRAHASNIRTKLRTAGINDELIKTIDGRGLRLSNCV